MRQIYVSFIHTMDNNKINNYLFYNGSFYVVDNVSAPPWHLSIMENGFYTIGTLKINETGYMV